MKRLPVALRRSMTYDRGSDPLMVWEQTTAGQWMACHPELSRRLKIDIWFCDPHTPWQRGSNENTNGLLRQFFPKGTDLGCLSQTALNDVARLMNDRPRKTLGWRTPAEAMAEDLTAIKTINRRTSILNPSCFERTKPRLIAVRCFHSIS
uniref:IS30 family transposase n=1 Tax=Octadecabacter antarcticus TaxID=1217908 RepID=UPI0001806A7D|nr:IS30 family transposase [Octadecabacter antarcticus]